MGLGTSWGSLGLATKRVALRGQHFVGLVFNSLGRDADRKTCKGMKGLIAEGEEYVKARGDNATIDAALIFGAQRVEHYEMAVYGTLRTYARALGHEDQATLLQQSLEEESAADSQLTRLAESGINVKAAVPAE